MLTWPISLALVFGISTLLVCKFVLNIDASDSQWVVGLAALIGASLGYLKGRE